MVQGRSKIQETEVRKQKSGFIALSFQLSAVRNEKTRRRAKGSRRNEEFIAISLQMSEDRGQDTE